MKRLVSFTLLLIFLVSSTMGCGDRYQSERCLYWASRHARDVLINPEAIPPQEFDRAVKAYTLILERYPDTQSARRAKIDLGSLYLAKKDYLKAREIYKETLKLYPDDEDISIKAQFSIARSYELGGSWARAVQEYRKIITGYPYTDTSLDLLMYIAQQYEEKGEIFNRDKAYEDAIMHYEKVARENLNTELGFEAQNLITMCYVKKSDWSGALKSLERLILDYPMATNLRQSIRLIADIAVEKLKRPELADEIFERFLKKNPDHPLRRHPATQEKEAPGK